MDTLGDQLRHERRLEVEEAVEPLAERMVPARQALDGGMPAIVRHLQEAETDLEIKIPPYDPDSGEGTSGVREPKRPLPSDDKTSASLPRSE